MRPARSLVTCGSREIWVVAGIASESCALCATGRPGKSRDFPSFEVEKGLRICSGAGVVLALGGSHGGIRSVIAVFSES